MYCPASRAEELARSLPPEDKEELLVFLLKELIEVNNGGRGLIPISTETEQLGYYVPPLAADEIYKARGPKLTPDREAEIAERLTRLHEAIPVEQAIRELKQQEIALRKEMARQQLM